ncbi:uncharacterized protein L201_004948 [Kwoniella dendrophila CBS 6074]|uniref:Uncharacterized protein n=1 Tax=Kwoniella dendrophila CBS 6074 TaxID=1295534 RepID=A0AAX4JYS8_9TREE
MPPRSTRGAVKDAETPGSKRKRRTTPEPNLKVVLPSPSASSQAASTSPEKANGGVDHEVKRQKLSIKINLMTEKPKQIEEEKDVQGALSKRIREGLSTVIAQ